MCVCVCVCVRACVRVCVCVRFIPSYIQTLLLANTALSASIFIQEEKQLLQLCRDRNADISQFAALLSQDINLTIYDKVLCCTCIMCTCTVWLV